MRRRAAETQQTPAAAPAEAISETDDEPADVRAGLGACSLRCVSAAARRRSADFREVQGRHRTTRSSCPAQPTSRRARQSRSRRSVLVRLRPLLRARSGDRVVARRRASRRMSSSCACRRCGTTHCACTRACSTRPNCSASSTPLHTLIFREIHVNGNQLNTVDKITAFFRSTASATTNSTRRSARSRSNPSCSGADFLNRRYRIAVGADVHRERQVQDRREAWPAAKRSCSRSSASSRLTKTAADPAAHPRRRCMLNIFVPQPHGLVRDRAGTRRLQIPETPSGSICSSRRRKKRSSSRARSASMCRRARR